MSRISAALREQVRAREQYRCAYCRTPESLTVVHFEVDHIVPVRAGGKTEPDNLCLACPACNRYKGAQTSAPDPQTGADVLLFHPRRDTWDEHFAWNDTHTKLVGLTPTGRATIAALRINRSRMVRLRGLWLKMGETF